MDKNKIYYLGLNLIAPGVGQFALKYYLKGVLMCILAIFSLIFSTFVIIQPLYENIKNLISGNDLKELVNINIPLLLFSFLILALIWIWSFADIIFFCAVPEKKKEN